MEKDINIDDIPIDEIKIGMRAKVIIPDTGEIYLAGTIIDKRKTSLDCVQMCIGTDEGEYHSAYYTLTHGVGNDVVFTD